MCYCTVCITGLIDNFLVGGGVTEGRGHGKKINDRGACNFLMTVQKKPTAPSPHLVKNERSLGGIVDCVYVYRVE